MGYRCETALCIKHDLRNKIEGTNIPRQIYKPLTGDSGGAFSCKYIQMANVSLKIGKHKSRTGGLTKAGREKYNRATGSNLKAPQPGGGPRKRSFCARMSGVKGPMKKPNGKPTRKALALRKWKC